MAPVVMFGKREESLIRALGTRHGRRGSEFCLCDGLRSGLEVLSLRPDLVEWIVLREGVSLPEGTHPSREPVVLPERDFSRLCSTVNSQGILIVARRPAKNSLTAPLSDSFVLVLDRVGDPGNLGTILRTARAVGLHEVWLTDGCADPFSDKVIRSASGAQFALGLRMETGPLDALARLLREQHGITRFYRTLPAGGENLFRAEGLFDRSALILGCEATGVAELENSLALNIPMPGTAESLNVAQAATVLLFEYVRRTVGS